MTKLSDLVLSDLEVRALRRLLAQHITAEDRAERAEQERREEARNNEYYETLTRLARETARQDGLTTLTEWRQAETSWEAFEAGEGDYGPLDVGEYFQCDDEWRESWELAYTSELAAMRQEANRERQ